MTLIPDRHARVWGGNPVITPTLHGEGAILRPFNHGDVPMIMEAAKDPTIPHLGVEDAGTATAAAVHVSEQISRSMKRLGWAFVIANSETLEPVGHIGAWLGNLIHGRVALGYWVLEQHRQHGYAGEALRLITPWVAQMNGVYRMELHIEPDNIASCRTAESAGYVLEATLKRWQVVDGTPRDMHVYAHFPSHTASG